MTDAFMDSPNGATVTEEEVQTYIEKQNVLGLFKPTGKVVGAYELAYKSSSLKEQKIISEPKYHIAVRK